MSARSMAVVAMMTLASVSGAQALKPGEGFVSGDDGTKLFYRITGAGRDTIVAIHGGPGVDLESIANDFAPLAREHVVIFYDQRGGGRSELPADTTRLYFPNHVGDLEALRKHFGISKMTLVAHSYGPFLAASYAIAHPDRVSRMVLFGPVPPRKGEFSKRFGASLNARLDSVQRAKSAEAARRLADPESDALQACRDLWAIGMRPRLAEPDRTLRMVKSDLCGSAPAGIRYGLTVTNRVVNRSIGDWDLRPALKTLDIPTLVVHGEQESIPMDLVEEWVSAMPNARLLKVPNAAHFTYAERPEFVWPAVLAFVKSGAWPVAAQRAAH